MWSRTSIQHIYAFLPLTSRIIGVLSKMEIYQSHENQIIEANMWIIEQNIEIIV